MILINPMVRIPLPRSLRREPARSTRPCCLRDKGFLTIGEHAGRINLDARMSHALAMFWKDYRDKELLMIAPGPQDALLVERSFLSYQDRVHLLRAGYLSVVTLVHDAYESLRAQFARHGIALKRTRFDDRAKSRKAQMDRLVATSSPLRQSVKGVAIDPGDSRSAIQPAK